MTYANVERAITGFRELPSESDRSFDESVNEFRARLAEIKDQLIQQAGKLEFAEADAKIRLAQIRLDQAETRTLAAEVKRVDTELSIFMLETKKGM